jgi:DNA-binding transcriptional LysR family regulator
VRIGSVTGPAIDLVLPVVRQSRLTAPGVTFEVIVAPSDVLCQDLLAGRIDLALGRLPEGPQRALLAMVESALEPVALVVRRDHPLARHPAPTVADLLRFDWVMPPSESLLTRAVLQRLDLHGVKAPPRPVATASFLLTLALLQQSDAIAPMALAVANSFAQPPDSPYSRLAIDLGIAVQPFGLVTRAGALLPPAAARVARAIAGRLAPGGPGGGGGGGGGGRPGGGGPPPGGPPPAPVHLACRLRIAAAGAVDEVHVIGAEMRRHDTGHEGGGLPMQPIAADALRGGRCQQGLDPAAAGIVDVDGHLQAVVELAEIGVPRQLPAVVARVEPADGQVGAVRQDGHQDLEDHP